MYIHRHASRRENIKEENSLNDEFLGLSTVWPKTHKLYFFLFAAEILLRLDELVNSNFLLLLQYPSLHVVGVLSFSVGREL